MFVCCLINTAVWVSKPHVVAAHTLNRVADYRTWTVIHVPFNVSPSTELQTNKPSEITYQRLYSMAPL